VRVVVADRQPLYRRGVADVLGDERDIVVVGETGDGADVPALVAKVRADVVLLDLEIPGGGVDACSRLSERRPEARVVVLTQADDDADLAGAVRAGARGYLRKDTAPEELVSAVRTVASGGSLLSPAMASRMLDEFAVLVRRQDSLSGAALSRRELEVLSLVAQGLGNKAIADRLFISENTVKNHVRNIHEKLQVHSRMEAVVRAVRDGLLQIA
jgi:two-component system NarL family response regulator